MTELEALQNHVESLKIEGLSIKERQEQDKRKTLKKYIVSINSQSVSPILDYENMNVFLLGLGKAEKIKSKVNDYTYSVIFTFGADKWSVLIDAGLLQIILEAKLCIFTYRKIVLNVTTKEYAYSAG